MQRMKENTKKKEEEYKAKEKIRSCEKLLRKHILLHIQVTKPIYLFLKILYNIIY